MGGILDNGVVTCNLNLESYNNSLSNLTTITVVDILAQST